MYKGKKIEFGLIFSTILGLSLLLLFALNGFGEKAYTVQVAASKSQISISQFSKNHNLTEDIKEVYFDGWYRYYVGNFENLQLASSYAEKLKKQTGNPGFFPRQITWNIAEGTITSTSSSSSPIEQEKPQSKSLKVDSTMQVKSVLTAKSEKIKPKDKSIVLWAIGDSDVYEFKNQLIKYGLDNFPPPLQKAYKKVVSKIYIYPILLFFVLVILFFIVNVFIVVCILYTSNKNKIAKDKHIRVYRNMYEGILRSYLFGEFDWDFARLKLKGLKKKKNRRIMASVLTDFQTNLRGGMDSQLIDIYSKLNLHKDAIRMTKNGFFYDKIIAIRELTNLCPQYGAEVIPKFINHSNYLVRAEAQTAFVTLHPEDPFSFLNNLISPFTRWTQISVFYFFRLNQLKVPSFVKFLESENSRVRNFSLRMMTYFQQLENTDEILKLLDNQMEMTRFLAIKAINDLRVFHGKDKLKSMYELETIKNRIEIIKALKNIGTNDDFEFLDTIVKSGTITEKTEACRTLYFMNQEGKNYLDHLNFNKELDIYIAHIIDPRN